MSVGRLDGRWGETGNQVAGTDPGGPDPGGGRAPGLAAGGRIAGQAEQPLVHDCESDTRSVASVVRATFQPPFTSPTTRSSGTNTSSMKTSLNSESPVISFSGRTVIPGEAMSTRK